MFSRLFGRSSHNQSGTVKTASALSEDSCSTRTETFQNTSQPNIGRQASQEQTVRKVAAPSPSNDNTESLSDQIEIIEKRQNVLEVKIQKEVEKAKQYLEKKNKTGATQCLQRKKIYEGQLTKLQSQLMNIERIRLAVEENIMNVEVMKAQRLAANDLKRLQQGMTPEQVDKDMDDLRDLMDKTAEVSEALAQDVGNDVADEDDIEQELAALQQETVNEKMANNLASGMADFIPKPSLNVPHTAKQDVNLSENSQKNLNDLSDSLTAQLATMTVPRGKIGASHRMNDEEDELAALERELNS